VSEKKILVPEGMLKAAYSVGSNGEDSQLAAEGLMAGIRWLSENPMAPTEEQEIKCFDFVDDKLPECDSRLVPFAVEWQRRMFLAPEQEDLNGIKNLLEPYGDVFKLVCEIDGMSEPGAPSSTGDQVEMRDKIFKFIIEAYRRGKESRQDGQ
jgi:hypothetical protein